MTTTDWKNQLYFGDNLDILRNHVADASVDLIYLDPPFNSKAKLQRPLPGKKRPAVRRPDQSPSKTPGTGALIPRAPTRTS